MNEVARRMITKLGPEFSLWDLLSLAGVTLLGASEEMKELSPYATRVLRLLIDGELADQDKQTDGVLPFKKQPLTS